MSVYLDLKKKAEREFGTGMFCLPPGDSWIFKAGKRLDSAGANGFEILDRPGRFPLVRPADSELRRALAFIEKQYANPGIPDEPWRSAALCRRILDIRAPRRAADLNGTPLPYFLSMSETPGAYIETSEIRLRAFAACELRNGGITEASRVCALLFCAALNKTKPASPVQPVRSA